MDSSHRITLTYFAAAIVGGIILKVFFDADMVAALGLGVIAMFAIGVGSLIILTDRKPNGLAQIVEAAAALVNGKRKSDSPISSEKDEKDDRLDAVRCARVVYVSSRGELPRHRTPTLPRVVVMAVAYPEISNDHRP